MDSRPLAVAIGAGVTTFLAVGAATIELVGVDIVAGIVGVLVGALAAVVAAVLVALRGRQLGAAGQSLLVGYAAFGVTYLVLAALAYVNAPGARSVLTVRRQIAVGAVVAVVVAAVAWWRGGRPLEA